ncbi:cytochrome P450 [Diplocarpon rosae]|nr:cytochrome P450 [Diplocarpon rosae]
MPMILCIASLILAILAIPLVKISKSYYQARRIGFPVVISPIDQSSRLLRLLGSRVTSLLTWLPFRLGDFVGFGHFFPGRYREHARLGPIYSINETKSKDIRLVVADPNLADDILARRKDFIKSKSMFKPLAIFGPNVDTLNGEAWQRHRRLTTPPFNERNSALVWNESVLQANGMLRSWISAGRDGVSKTTSDVMTLALHVLTAAGFGKSYEFDGGVTKLTGNHTMSYKESLRTILSNIFVSYMVKSKNGLSYIPQIKVLEVESALSEFKQYMKEMFEEEKTRVGSDSSKDSLISALVRASESEKLGEGRSGLTDEEMYGNLFIYNLAGHDTTANTIGYAVYLMASEPKWHAWIREELDFVFGKEIFTSIGRAQAEMWQYETLRLYGPVVIIPKLVTTNTTIDHHGIVHQIPPRTAVFVNITALCTCPEYWGPDPLTWRPDRWITTESHREEIKQPPTGVFLPWASGPRVCPGKKFAQVEFVAVIARLFRNHRVTPEMIEGESEEDVKKRILQTVEDSKLVMTLRMNHPERVKLIWEEK